MCFIAWIQGPKGPINIHSISPRNTHSLILIVSNSKWWKLSY